MKRWLDLVPAAPAVYLTVLFVGCVAARLFYPYDLEWMEGGMLAHAWRLERGLPLYTPPDGDWIPYIYPPGYSAVLASLPGGVDYPIGRLISWAGTLAAAGAMVHIVWRLGRSWTLGLVFAMLYFATFRASGGFLDLVRPDALAVGLGAWAMALTLDGRKGTEVAGGLLLCASFLVKHNLAAYGAPLALGLLLWRGWKPALRFTIASAVPALIFVAYLQWRSDGGFLTYLLEVPRSHPLNADRGLPGTQGELGHWLGVALNVGLLGLTVAAPRRFQAVHPAVLWVASLVGGAGAAWWGVAQPPVLGAATPHWTIMAVTFFSLGAASVAAMVSALAAVVERRVDGEWFTAFGVLAVGLVLGSMMRAHNGGFINVLMPLHWAILAICGIVLGQLRVHYDHLVTWVATALLAAAQVVWLVVLVDYEPVQPTPFDLKGGARVVQVVKDKCDGPIYSPYAAWLPVLAGQEPSLHLIALWDVDHKEGPYHDDVKKVKRAIAKKHYACVLEFGRRPLGQGVTKHYVNEHTFKLQPTAMRPKTGWPVRPRTLMVPK